MHRRSPDPGILCMLPAVRSDLHVGPKPRSDFLRAPTGVKCSVLSSRGLSTSQTLPDPAVPARRKGWVLIHCALAAVFGAAPLRQRAVAHHRRRRMEKSPPGLACGPEGTVASLLEQACWIPVFLQTLRTTQWFRTISRDCHVGCRCGWQGHSPKHTRVQAITRPVWRQLSMLLQ